MSSKSFDKQIEAAFKSGWNAAMARAKMKLNSPGEWISSSDPLITEESRDKALEEFRQKELAKGNE